MSKPSTPLEALAAGQRLRAARPFSPMDDESMQRWARHIGFNICWRRLVLGLTVEEAAKRAMLAAERWLAIEQGDLRITAHEYDCITYVLKVGPIELICRKGKERDVTPRVIH